jgi:A/G-specific adenine glycosylase
MLQQTQTHRVVPFYTTFLKHFPTLRSLAQARQKEVLRAWQGLGYNRRALNLQKAAQNIVAEHHGRVPETAEELVSLPSIGPYTAAAIRAFAFNKPGIVIETNIRTVFLHEFFPRKKKVSDALLAPLIEATVDRRQPGRWYAALMGYGVMLKATQGNASRRSTTYAKQPPFAGSDRAARGKLLKLLLTKNRSFSELAKQLEEPVARVRRLVKRMEQEGFVRMHKDKVRLL